MASEAAKRSSDKADKPAGEKLERVPTPGPDADHPINPARELSRRQLWLLGGMVLLANIPLIHYFFRHVLMEMPVTVSVPFQDDFNRPEIGPNYWTTGGLWRIENGELHSPGVKDNPLWLQLKLPNDASIDFDVRSMNAEGDIRFEAWGDGLNAGSGYRFIFGGMNNQLTAIAKIDDHGPAFDANEVGMAAGGDNQGLVAGHTLDELSRTGVLGPTAPWRVQRLDLRVQATRMYHVHVDRKASELSWYIDNQLMLHVKDPSPLMGAHHDRFGFSSNETDLFFDNLSVQAN